MVRTRWSGTRKCSFQRMKMFSRWAALPIMGWTPTLFVVVVVVVADGMVPELEPEPEPELDLLEERAARIAGLYCRNAVNLLQWFISILSLAPQLGCWVRNPYLLPMISPSKYVVNVGLSSVRPIPSVSVQYIHETRRSSRYSYVCIDSARLHVHR